MATFPSRLMRSLHISLVLSACGFVACVSGAREPEYPPEMYSRPELRTEERITVFQDGLLELWLQALDRPDAELRRATLDTITLAHKRNVPGIEMAKERLMQIIRDQDEHPTVLKSAANALIQFDARDAAEDLAKVTINHGSDLGQVIEPALIQWNSLELKQHWIERITTQSATNRMLLLAIDGLATIKAKEAIPVLSKLLSDSAMPAFVRTRAARAIGLIGSDAELELVDRVMNSAVAEPLRSVIAVNLLNASANSKAIALKKRLAGNASSVVQTKALEQLFKIDPALVDALADELITSKDANIRTWCLRAMLHTQSQDRVAAIAPLLNDVNPTLRRKATTGLLNWAENADLKRVVIAETMSVLRQNSWQGCEQSIVVLTKLNHGKASGRFVELLKHERPEVKIASAWGLQKLRVKEELPDMLDHAKEIYEGFASGRLSRFTPGVVAQQTHLFLAFGDQAYEPAIELLLEYVPKNFDLGNDPRAAACWSLGFLYANDPPPDVVQQLRERLLDSQSAIPEEEPIRVMCAVSFGRMKLKSCLPSLREEARDQSLASRACYWAIEKITGEKPPAIINKRYLETSWFLAPIVQ